MAHPLRGRRGMLLPMALLGLLALTALAIMTFALVHGMLMDGTLERRHLEGWAAAAPVERQEVMGGFEVTRHEWESEGLVGRSRYSVARVLDPYGDSRRWGAAIYASLVGGVDRIRWAPLPCGGGVPVEARAGPLLNFVDPLVARMGSEPVSVEGLDLLSEGVMHMYHTDGTLWLISEGDLEVRGEGVGRGVLLSLGGVILGGDVQWEGGIAARGTVRVEDDAEVIGDWCAIEEAIAALDEPRRLYISGGEALGRF